MWCVKGCFHVIYMQEKADVCSLSSLIVNHVHSDFPVFPVNWVLPDTQSASPVITLCLRVYGVEERCRVIALLPWCKNSSKVIMVLSKCKRIYVVGMTLDPMLLHFSHDCTSVWDISALTGIPWTFPREWAGTCCSNQSKGTTSGWQVVKRPVSSVLIIANVGRLKMIYKDQSLVKSKLLGGHQRSVKFPCKGGYNHKVCTIKQVWVAFTTLIPWFPWAVSFHQSNVQVITTW